MKKKLLYTVGALIIIFLVLQLYQPVRSNPPIDESETIQVNLTVPEEVDAILKRSCYACHSNETRWPWYSHVAPGSWLVANDVNTARRFMNFSSWGAYRKAKKLSLLEAICNVTSGGLMPLPEYLLMHPSAKLSKEEIEILCEWSESQMGEILGRSE